MVDNASLAPQSHVVTEIPPSTNAIMDELEYVSVSLTNTTRMTLTTNVWVGDIHVYDANSFITLGSYQMDVNAEEHHLDSDLSGEGSTNRVDLYSQIVWHSPPDGGTVISLR